LAILTQKLSIYGEIQSQIADFSKDFNLPFAIVCFKEVDAAEKCYEAINAD
jgi:hypothetical protein